MWGQAFSFSFSFFFKKTGRRGEFAKLLFIIALLGQERVSCTLAKYVWVPTGIILRETTSYGGTMYRSQSREREQRKFVSPNSRRYRSPHYEGFHSLYNARQAVRQAGRMMTEGNETCNSLISYCFYIYLLRKSPSLYGGLFPFMLSLGRNLKAQMDSLITIG